MILALSITLAVLTLLALGIFVYFKFFALVYDKDGMVYQAQGGPHLCNLPPLLTSQLPKTDIIHQHHIS